MNDVTATAQSRPGTGIRTPVLAAMGLGAGHGPVRVIRSLDLEVHRGTVLGVLGPNGAGKTTLLMTLAGLLPRQGGSVRLAGTELPTGRPAVVNRAGLVLVPDDRALFTGLTVRQNIEIARRRDAALTFDDVLDLFPALARCADRAVGSLSGGEQQMLAMARGLVQDPKALLIDEMSMGLAPVIVEGLLPIVRRIADETGVAVVLVEQHVRLALEVADEALVLVRGAVALRGTARDLAAAPSALEAAYLGDGGAGSGHEPPGSPAPAQRQEDGTV
ncbi:amino acid/amide ABC transporter ATP-binding protein 2 (HAAT family) [Actinocorallia herbida]|uniref:Amino acid/amide ABC transporter ATP-binding protein 2 (HAAT family) n=1 Tax=Actinocorallia herbida TaxID=58109 RepID=A0A3N1D370_9ACTN|nr:ABC transporter ATP-binding protein [Actinocorallia herbida]ROO87987.1 amino acid/amide ABC transporter ATP-binding protein 2 (HAAT family) [Actinocorallia herbida]